VCGCRSVAVAAVGSEIKGVIKQAIALQAPQSGAICAIDSHRFMSRLCFDAVENTAREHFHSLFSSLMDAESTNAPNPSLLVTRSDDVCAANFALINESLVAWGRDGIAPSLRLTLKLLVE
jgi:hypothetical protein